MVLGSALRSALSISPGYSGGASWIPFFWLQMRHRAAHSVASLRQAHNSSASASDQNVASGETHDESTSKRPARLATMSWRPNSSTTPIKNVPVYILHGLFGYKEEFLPFGQIIADRTGHEVSAFDARNHGESEHVKVMNYVDMGDDIVHAMESANVKEAIFVAHSMGAGTAMTLSLRRPDLVKALFSIDVGISNVPRAPQLRSFIRSLHTVTFKHDLSLEENRDALKKLMLFYEVNEFLIDHRLLPNVIKNDGQVQWRFNLESITEDSHKLTQPPTILTSHTQFLNPVYVLIGDCSDYIRWEHEPMVYKMFPNAQLQRVPDAGHWVHLDKPEIFIEAVVKFINLVK